MRVDVLSPLSSHATVEDTSRQAPRSKANPKGGRHFKSQPASTPTLREHPVTSHKYQSGTSVCGLGVDGTPLGSRIGVESITEL